MFAKFTQRVGDVDFDDDDNDLCDEYVDPTEEEDHMIDME
jgi:hypothetical protein